MTPAYACAVVRYFPFLSRHQNSPSSAEQSIVDWRSAQYVEVELCIYVTCCFAVDAIASRTTLIVHMHRVTQQNQDASLRRVPTCRDSVIVAYTCRWIHL
jgi:hypothetical protein